MQKVDVRLRNLEFADALRVAWINAPTHETWPHLANFAWTWCRDQLAREGAVSAGDTALLARALLKLWPCDRTIENASTAQRRHEWRDLRAQLLALAGEAAAKTEE